MIALAVAGATVAFTAGCGAGRETQTDQQVAAVPGGNVKISAAPDGSVSVRNALIVYPGPNGYERGADAPIEVRVFNDTKAAIRLIDVRSPAGDVVLVREGAASPTPSATAQPASPDPSMSPPPAATGGRVDVEIPASGMVVLAPGAGQYLQLAGLTEPIKQAGSVALTFVFGNNIQLPEVRVPIAPPFSPEPRAPSVIEGGGGHD